MIKIYNTLTRQKEEFAPVSVGKVNIYACGVTVYDHCHIGHARSLYTFEVVRRYLKWRGYEVRFVRNITDIDDKIINRARERSIDWHELVDTHIKSYYEDLAALGIPKADFEPRATENIPEMIDFIKGLLDKGFAYPTSSGVYFNVRKLTDYGSLSGQNVDEMRSGSRIEKDEEKKDPLDFALWKTSKENEPFWPSPWGNGRPGWHIECSVMSRKYLNTDTLDIHGGGLDLKFPHHENERAQSQALTGKTFAKYWMHHGLLTINKEKMAKSLGNFFVIKDVLKKFPPQVLKILYLQTHYAHPVDFSWERMEEAKNAYERIDIALGKLEKISDAPDQDFLKEWRDRFIAAMDDDFNTPQGMAVLFEAVNQVNQMLGQPDKGKVLAALRNLMQEVIKIFGLAAVKTTQGLSDQQIEEKINQRIEYKKQKKFQEADAVRKELDSSGIILEDTKGGTTWRRKI